MDYETTIVSIKDETPDVKTFRMDYPEGLKFVAGQYFLMLLPEVDGLEGLSRPFTFASSPSEQRFIEVTVKRMGEFTTAMFNLKGGERAIIRGPKGEHLNYDGHIGKDSLFIAGGSGITPFISAIRYHTENDLTRSITLLYSNRLERDIIFSEELKAAESEKIKVVHTLTQEIPQGWVGEHGLIDRAMILRNVPGCEKMIWFICGPPPLTKAMRDIAREMGISGSDIRSEPWELPGSEERR